MAEKVLVLVAHPDDETLWCGGLLLSNPGWETTIFSFTRGSDPDRAPKFLKACAELGAKGIMADIDDGPEQRPLKYHDYRRELEERLVEREYDIVLTHSPFGEYTSHLRHEEVSRSAILAVYEGMLRAGEVWFFWYSDQNRGRMPSAKEDADLLVNLGDEDFEKKGRILFDIYGFSRDSWEGKTLPKTEGFKIRKELFIRNGK